MAEPDLRCSANVYHVLCTFIHNRKTPFHPSSLHLIKSSSVRFVDPSSHANERFNLQLVSFSIQDESHHLTSFSLAC